MTEALSTNPTRVSATPAALALIEQLLARHGELLFHPSGGCCDASAPMCFPRAEFMTGDSDVCLGGAGAAAGVDGLALGAQRS
jgi:uncharacterized protein